MMQCGSLFVGYNLPYGRGITIQMGQFGADWIKDLRESEWRFLYVGYTRNALFYGFSVRTPWGIFTVAFSRFPDRITDAAAEEILSSIFGKGEK